MRTFLEAVCCFEGFLLIKVVETHFVARVKVVETHFVARGTLAIAELSWAKSV